VDGVDGVVGVVGVAWVAFVFINIEFRWVLFGGILVKMIKKDSPNISPICCYIVDYYAILCVNWRHNGDE
jgi:hypothetical protein